MTKENVNDFVLIGHSMGGMIALKYYELFNKEKRDKALILCDTTYQNILEHKRIKLISPFIRHVLDFLISHERINKNHFAHLKDIDLTAYETASDYFIFYEGLHNTPMKSVFSCLEAMMDFDASSILSRIKVPVLILQGEEDKIIPKADSIELYQKTKHAEIDFIPKGKHCVNLESPELVEEHVFSFLQEHNLKASPA